MPLLALLALLAAVPDGQATPRFGSEVRMIRLDVSVVDRAGRAVPGLGAGDFVVREDGRPVEIAFFEAVANGLALAAAGAEASVARVEPPRNVVLLVDMRALTPRQMNRARQATERYLRESTADGDRVQLVNLSTGVSWQGEMPGDRARLMGAARRLGRIGSPWDGDDARLEEESESVEGGASVHETSGQFLSTFARGSGLLGTLEALLVEMGGLQGRKAVVLLSTGFPGGTALDRRLQQVATLAREVSATVYFLDLAGMDGLEIAPGRKVRAAFDVAWARSGGSQDLAEATGGFVARFSNTLAPAFRRVAEEMRTYYVVGYVPPRPDDGRFREVEVRLRVPGLSARTKKGYLAAGRP